MLWVDIEGRRACNLYRYKKSWDAQLIQKKLEWWPVCDEIGVHGVVILVCSLREFPGLSSRCLTWSSASIPGSRDSSPFTAMADSPCYHHVTSEEGSGRVGVYSPSGVLLLHFVFSSSESWLVIRVWVGCTSVMSSEGRVTSSPSPVREYNRFVCVSPP